MTSSARRDVWLAAGMAVAIALVTSLYGARAVGGSDAYGYVSQADLWLKGDLKIDQSFVAEVPWPGSARSFSPLGYRPDPLDYRRLVPQYAPGLPIVLALAKAIAGQTAMFLVVADTTARMVVAPAQLPVGVVTAMIGGPFFLFLLIRHSRKVYGPA